jgi:hypothetical protein
MNIKFKILICSLVFLVFIQNVFGQTSSEEKLRKARILMSDYQDAALFRDMGNGTYDPSWEGIFRSLFKTNKLIFDIPFRVDDKRYHEGLFQLEPGADAQVISIYQEQVSLDRYIETIRNAYDLYSITDFSYLFAETKFDTLALGSQNKIIFEYRKTFANTIWSLRDAKSYLFEIQFFDGQPLITAVKMVDENIAKTDVILAFIDSNHGGLLADLICHIRLEFDESINNISLITRTNEAGLIKPGLISNRATIKIDSAFSIDGERFSVPDDWKINGYKVSSQPPGGFIVPLQPWKWNGFSWSARAFGGMMSQSENYLGNFSSNSDFTNNNGYMFGLGLEVSKLFSLAQISSVFSEKTQSTDRRRIKMKKNTFLGVGTGISYYQYQYRITSDGFTQNPYPFLDRREEPLMVRVSGSSYEETVSGIGVSIPVFLEFRKNMPKRNVYFRAFSVQAGVNLMIPFETKYELSGNFTRHGYYEQFNQQLMISDPFYNYYTSMDKTHAENLISNDIYPAWMFRLNGYINPSKGKTDNLLDIGILFMLPFNGPGSLDPELAWIATGNDDFNSLSNSSKEVFNYFIGLSIGYNFIRYRL